MDFQTGQVLFRKFDKNKEELKTKWDWLNWIISFESYPETHACIIIDVKENELTIATSEANGFQIETWDAIDLSAKIEAGLWAVESVKNIDTSKIMDYAYGMEGSPYGYFEYLKFVLHFLTKKWFFRNWVYGRVCSEEVYRLLYLCNVKLDCAIYPVTPHELRLSIKRWNNEH